MFVLRLIGKALLIPVWILIAIAWIFVKEVVSIYSLAEGFVVFGFGTLIIGILICYHDWKQVMLLICICILSLLPVLCGSIIHLLFKQMLCTMKNLIMN